MTERGIKVKKFILKNAQNLFVLLLALVVNTSCVSEPILYDLDHAQGEMAGEATQSSVILQSRLTQGKNFVQGDIPGAAGTGCFELSKTLNFKDSFKTEWAKALPENDPRRKAIDALLITGKEDKTTDEK